MQKDKTHIYLVPGLGASSGIYKNIDLPKDRFELHFIEWKTPLSKVEPIEEYAKRMSLDVKHEHSVLIGVSFGGVVVQEMKKYLNVDKTIIISSVKSKDEMPRRMHNAKKRNATRFIPFKLFTNIEKYEKFAFGNTLKKRIKLYKKYISVRDDMYLPWAFRTLINWERNSIDEDVVHIHGTADGVFPYKNIGKCIRIDGGTHIMVLDKAKKINTILKKVLN